MSNADGPDLLRLREAAVTADTMSEFMSYVVNRLFSVGLKLESAHSIVGAGPAGDRLVAATEELDGVIRDIRTAAMFGRVVDRPALLRERMAQTARAMQVNALAAAALLERQADLARPPVRLDYPTEIKRWRAIAYQAERMAKRWEQPP